MHELTDGSVEKLARLIGDEERARLKIQRIRSLADVIESDVQDEVKIFKALSDPCRLAILKLLQNGEFCVCEIMIALDRPQSTTSHHLSILKDAGLIKERKVGKWSNYRLADGAVIEIMNQARLLSRLQK